MRQWFGWTGSVLHVDLTSGGVQIENPEPSLYQRCIGGKGLAGAYLAPHVRKRWDDPEMPLLLFTGPLVGTPAPTSGRMVMMSRSPLTGTVGDASVGGTLGLQLKRAGLDGVVITGRSETWRGLRIRDGEVRLVDASEVVGKQVSEVVDELSAGADGQRAATAVIGPAAEQGVRFANIVVDRHFFAGRNGLGLVMASKRLKFISVKGTGKVSIHDRAELDAAGTEIQRLASASPVLLGGLGITRYGTAALYDLMHSRRMMPTDNFRLTWLAPAAGLNAWSFHDRFGAHKAGCAGCRVMCKKRADDGRMLPEFETMSHFSALLGNTDPETVMAANHLCGEAGMDTISAGVTLACYTELRGRPLASGEIISLLQDIVAGRGEGGALMQGAARYAASMNAPDAAIAVKGQELPAYDPRGACGMALAYVTSTRGGCHLRAYPIAQEILRKPVAIDRFTFSGKARIIKISEDANAAVDSLTACKFMFFAASLEEYARAYTGVTGVTISGQELMRAGERTYYLERIMNAANGFTAADDDLPERFFTTPGTSGDGIEIPALDRDAFLDARARYYRIRGLDEDGMPTLEKCRELGLEEEARGLLADVCLDVVDGGNDNGG